MKMPTLLSLFSRHHVTVSAVDFFVKLLTSRLGQFSQYLAAMSSIVFLLLTKVL